jgi:UDP-N-acetylmuramoyl-tripeptide--D-alanyl-D-alanine ligase
VRVHIGGLDYKMINGKQKLHITSQLLGRHNIGPLSLVAALAHEYGMKAKDIELAIQQTKPHEHRMQPYQLGGAWIIDDTYNGNIEGIRAGTQLLAELPARRKIYITPGLVDQGPETQKVHQEMGQLIAAAKPDMVVLMQNSVTKHIQAGLADGAYKGRVKLEPDPLHFYTNLEHFVAAGDIVMMQNDWPDNYR